MKYQRVTREYPTIERPREAVFSARSDLHAIARLAAGLTPERGDPERFYLRREEVVTRLYALADVMEGGR